LGEKLGIRLGLSMCKNRTIWKYRIVDFDKEFYEGESLEAMIDMQDTTAGYIYIDPLIEDDRFEIIDD
jgi:hypothetical protein